MPDLSIEDLLLFLFFVVPGFVALKVYDLLVPGVRRDFGSSVIELVAYSMINLAINSWAVVLLLGERVKAPWAFYLLTLVVVFLAPSLIAVGIFSLRRSRIFQKWVLDPIPSAWDEFFGRRTTCWVLIHLKNGHKIGGFYGKDSYASAFPNPAEVYLEEVWRVDSAGHFIKRVPRTLGMVVRYSDCHLIEFFIAE